MTDFNGEFVELRAKLDNTAFGDLVSNQVLVSMMRRNLVAELLPPDFPTVRRFIDSAPLPHHEIDPTLDDFEAITDLVRRAEALYYNQVEATCPRSRALIESVENVSFIGILLQANLVPSQPRHQMRPPWYNPNRPKPPTYRNLPSLFEVFGQE